MKLSTLSIAWRNLGRNRKRTALAVLAIAVGQFGLLATQGLMRGYADNIRRAITGPMIGHAQVHHPDWREERAMDLYIPDGETVLDRIRSEEMVAGAAARIYAPVLVAPERDAFIATVLGVDVDAESRPYGLLSGMEDHLPEGHVLIGYRLARKIRAGAGDELAIIGQAADGSYATGLFTVREVIRSPVDLVNQSGVVMDLEEARRLFVLPGGAHEIVVRGRPGTDAGELAGKLRSAPVLSELEVLAWREIVPEFAMIIEMVDYVGYFVLVLVFVAAVAGIANTLMMGTFERLHEFGMLLALGSRPRRLVRMIVVEAVLLGILGILTGTLMGGVFTAVAARTGIDMASWGGEHVGDLAYQGLKLPLEIYPRLEWLDPAVGAVAVIFTSLVAAVWPASVAAGLEPMEAMRA